MTSTPTEYVEPDVDRTHLTIIDGELYDAHRHTDGAGESPATTLAFDLLSVAHYPEGSARTWTVDAAGYRILVSVVRPPVAPPSIDVRLALRDAKIASEERTTPGPLLPAPEEGIGPC